MTNDDGIASSGLPPLATHLTLCGSVTIGAPDREMSGTGTAVNMPGGDGREVRISPHDIEAATRAAFSVSATPALSVLLAARGVFGEIPEIVVSGPNWGANLGHDVQHSGTVGAAYTAVRQGMHGIAVSVAVKSSEPHWDSAAEITRLLVSELAEADTSGPVLANLNVPDRPLDEIRGIRTVGLAGEAGYIIEGFDETHHDDGSRVLLPRVVANQRPADLDTDIGSLREGWATLTWLRLPGITQHEPDVLAALHQRTSDAAGFGA